MPNQRPTVFRLDAASLLATQILLGNSLGREALGKISAQLSASSAEIVVISLVNALCVDYRFVGEAIGALADVGRDQPVLVVELLREFHRVNVLEGIVWKTGEGYKTRSVDKLQEILRQSSRRVVLLERVGKEFTLEYVGAEEREIQMIDVVERQAERTVAECARELRWAVDQCGEILSGLAKKGFVYRISPSGGDVEARFVGLKYLLSGGTEL